MKKTLLIALIILFLIVVAVFYRRGEQATPSLSQETMTWAVVQSTGWLTSTGENFSGEIISLSENWLLKTEQEEKVVYPISWKCPDTYEKVGDVCYPACPIWFVVEETDWIDYYGNAPRSCIEDLTYLADKIENQKQLSWMTEHIWLITSIFKSWDSYSMSIDYVDLFLCSELPSPVHCIKNINKKTRTFAIADEVLVSTMYVSSCENWVNEDGSTIWKSQYGNPYSFPDLLATRESCKDYPTSNTKAQPYSITLDKNSVIRIIESAPLSS